MSAPSNSGGSAGTDIGDVGGHGGVGAGGTGMSAPSNRGGSAGVSEPDPGEPDPLSRCDISDACVSSEAGVPGPRVLWAEYYNNALGDLFGATPVADPRTFPVGLDEAGLTQVSDLGHQVAIPLELDEAGLAQIIELGHQVAPNSPPIPSRSLLARRTSPRPSVSTASSSKTACASTAAR